MLNQIFALMQRPAKGWDPVPREYARKYAAKAWDNVDADVIDELGKHIGGFGGKRILDLGGGPGQYSVAFALKGASVTWHDVSKNYMEIAREQAVKLGVSIEWSLGYMEDAASILSSDFDLVFSRVCWYYAKSDQALASAIYALVAPGGYAYIDTHIDAFEVNPGLSRRLVYGIYRNTGFKIAHPHPRRTLIARLFMKYELEKMLIDYSSAYNDKMLFKKARNNK